MKTSCGLRGGQTQTSCSMCHALRSIHCMHRVVTDEWLRDNRYRCDPEVEPPRMMPAVLPDLTVAEEEEQLSMGTRASAAASRAGLRAGRAGSATSKL